MNALDNISRHPNPIFSRNDWLDLNGDWQFDFDKENVGLEQKWQTYDSLPMKIRVPYVYQSELSGIATKEFCNAVWYKTKIRLPDSFRDKRLILHFGAVDYEATVWINGQKVCEHKGGYTSFQADITSYVDWTSDNDLTLRAYDDVYNARQSRGKQLWGDEAVFGCWYTRYTGIWQPVWLEAVEAVHIERFTLTPIQDKTLLTVEADIKGDVKKTEYFLQVEVLFKGALINTTRIKISNYSVALSLSIQDKKLFPFEGIALWWPDCPELYDVTLTILEEERVVDQVNTYFGIRKLETMDGMVFLNNRPFYQRLILNQGYYPKGLITPDNEDIILEDIRTIKALGYNGIRIHEKIECPRLLYWCDRLGLIVWEEFPSMYEYCPEEGKQILGEILDMVGRDINHPCIFTWVLFNESWGIIRVKHDQRQQNLTESAYHAVKALDPNRFVISNDGWEHTKSDLCTFHDYTADGQELASRITSQKYREPDGNPYVNEVKKLFAEGYSYEGQPILISEYGGISFAADDGWGYNDKVENEQEFLNRFEGQMEAIRGIAFIQGFCFTQYTDVEHEQNGLLTIDRKDKVDRAKICEINLRHGPNCV